MSAQALPELASVPWRARTDERWLRRYGRIWQAWTLACTIPFGVAAVVMMLLEPLAAPVSFAALAHAWVIPELYAFRGASVVRPKRAGALRDADGRGAALESAVARPGARAAEPATEPEAASDPEAVAQGLLGDLLDHEPRELQRRTGLALEPGAMGTWLVGEAGALLVMPGGRRVHCFCVRVPDPELPPSDRIAHLLLALRVDEEGFATVANHAFCGAAWRVRRRLPVRMRPALDAAGAAAR